MSLSCKNSENEILNNTDNAEIENIPIITNKFKIEFLNEILKDTSIYNLRHYKNPYIFQHSYYRDETRPNVKNGHLENISLSKFISIYLKIKDTSFVSKQLDSLNIMDMGKLKDYGFKFIDWEKLKKYNYTTESLIVENLVSNDSIEKLEKAIEVDKIIWLTKPVFNKRVNKAYIEVGNSIYWSNALLYEKKKDKWVFNKVIMTRNM